MPKKNRIPAGQGASNFLPSEQENSIEVQQQDSIPVEQYSSEASVKGTYYITAAHDLKLDQIRLARKRRGEKIDKSALIREAIDLLQE